MELRIGWLYGHEMNIYGDRGNVMSLARRSEWRGISAPVTTVGVGQPLSADQFDLLFWGGGQDREQVTVSQDLQGAKGEALKAAIENGVPILAICGGYQLLGHGYQPFGGDLLPGIGVMDVTSEAGDTRFIGNTVVDAGELGTLVGFENHSGKSFLGPDVSPLGKTIIGHGNNGQDGTEGARVYHAIGSYLHGSLLPKNPHLADWLIARALERKYGVADLAPLNDDFEQRAHDRVIERAKTLCR